MSSFFAWLVLVMLIALAPAYIARSKGRSLFGWWVYGVLLWIVALPHALLIGDRRDAARGRALPQSKGPRFSADDTSDAAIAARVAAEDLRRFREQAPK